MKITPTIKKEIDRIWKSCMKPQSGFQPRHKTIFFKNAIELMAMFFREGNWAQLEKLLIKATAVVRMWKEQKESPQ